MHSSLYADLSDTIFIFRVTIEQFERNTVITLRKGVRQDTGKYRLILSNSVGECEEEADVVVLGRCLNKSLITWV